MSWSRRTTVSFRSKRESEPVPIISSAAIAAERMDEGHVIPVLIIDGRERPDVETLILAHESLPPGDIEFVWATKPWLSHDTILLLIKFIRPAELSILLQFDIASEGVLVEHILDARALYLQLGQPGDKFIDNMVKPRILLELPDTGFDPIWKSMFLRAMVKFYRKRGFGRREAKRAAEMVIQEYRKTYVSLRVK